jgi:hypothetical protein
MPMPQIHLRQRQELLETLRGQSEAYATVAAARETRREAKYSPARLLQGVSDAIKELTGYLESPILMDALDAFHFSAAERQRARSDLNAFLREAGLAISDRVNFRLFGNDWCIEATMCVHADGTEAWVGLHYDSNLGWGSGRCP